jgi:hypothetical protein
VKYSYYNFSDFLKRSKEPTDFLDRHTCDIEIIQDTWKGLDILVEDAVAKLLLEVVVAKNLRSPIRIIPIGSATAVMRHLAVSYKATRYASNNVAEVCAFLDGDMSLQQPAQIKQFMNTLENPYEQKAARSWLDKRLLFLPGHTWPEAWIVSPRDRQPFYERFKQELNISISEVDNLFTAASKAGKHRELSAIAAILKLDRIIVTNYLIESAFESEPEEISKIISSIERLIGRSHY